jgi:LPXTG-site transpeptidase (sortase) family protein
MPRSRASLLLRFAAMLLALVGVVLLGASSARAEGDGTLPVAIRIGEIGVKAPVEVRTTVGGQMQDPTAPEVVAWYDDSARLGTGGNAVVSGHLEVAGYGPAVFARLEELEKGDVIALLGEDGEVYRYRVVWARPYPAVGGPWTALTGPTKRESLTLITCAPPWDPALGHYANRLVVRAVRQKG